MKKFAAVSAVALAALSMTAAGEVLDLAGTWRLSTPSAGRSAYNGGEVWEVWKVWRWRRGFWRC